MMANAKGKEVPPEVQQCLNCLTASNQFIQGINALLNPLQQLIDTPFNPHQNTDQLQNERQALQLGIAQIVLRSEPINQMIRNIETIIQSYGGFLTGTPILSMFRSNVHSLQRIRIRISRMLPFMTDRLQELTNQFNIRQTLHNWAQYLPEGHGRDESALSVTEANATQIVENISAADALKNYTNAMLETVIAEPPVDTIDDWYELVTQRDATEERIAQLDQRSNYINQSRNTLTRIKAQNPDVFNDTQSDWRKTYYNVVVDYHTILEQINEMRSLLTNRLQELNSRITAMYNQRSRLLTQAQADIEDVLLTSSQIMRGLEEYLGEVRTVVDRNFRFAITKDVVDEDLLLNNKYEIEKCMKEMGKRVKENQMRINLIDNYVPTENQNLSPTQYSQLRNVRNRCQQFINRMNEMHARMQNRLREIRNRENQIYYRLQLERPLPTQGVPPEVLNAYASANQYFQNMETFLNDVQQFINERVNRPILLSLSVNALSALTSLRDLITGTQFIPRLAQRIAEATNARTQLEAVIHQHRNELNTADGIRMQQRLEPTTIRYLQIVGRMNQMLYSLTNKIEELDKRINYMRGPEPDGEGGQ